MTHLTRRQILASAAATAAVAAMPSAAAIAVAEQAPILTAFKLQGLGEAAEAIRGWYVLRKTVESEGVVSSIAECHMRTVSGVRIGEKVDVELPWGTEEGFVVDRFIPESDDEGEV